MPATTDAGPVFVIARSACGVNVSESVLLAELGSDAPGGGVTVAVFTRTPTAAGETVPVAVKVTVPPTGTVTVSLMEPLPLGLQTPPPVPTHVQVTPVSAAGNVSVTSGADRVGRPGVRDGDRVGHRLSPGPPWSRRWSW